MRKTAQILFFLLFLILTSFKNVYASGCSVSISPSEVLTDSTTGFTITVNNTGDNPIQFVKIPTNFDSNFTVGDATSSGWDLSLASGGYGMIGGSISAGSSNNFSVNGTVGGNEATISWNLEASESSDGSNSFSCNSVSINSVTQLAETPAPEPTAPPLPVPTVTNVSATIGSTTAVLSWNTDIDSSGVFSYGATNIYGLNKYTSTGMSHSVSLSSLTPSTIYHYKIESTSLGGTTITNDNTFTTGAPGATSVITTTVTSVVTNTTTNTVTRTLSDTTPPAVRYKTVFKKIYEEAPLVEVVSSDETGVARVEYSTDGGSNWSPVDLGNNIGNKQITSEFNLNISEDGDYVLLVRAVDVSGNKKISKEINFTIDRLPPRLGPLVIMAGPLLINSNNSVTELITGVDYKFIISAAGGPNKISMICDNAYFDFTKNAETGVWFAKINFTHSGECALKVSAIDGAGNTKEVNKNNLKINNLGQFKNGMITVYWYDSYEKKFVKWDGEPYGQLNPISTNITGGYSFLLPAGKYYLEAKSLGKRTGVSNIIETTETVFINDDWELLPAWRFWEFKQEKIINPKVLGENGVVTANFMIPNANLDNLSTLEIRGKTSVVGLLSTWHPSANDYLKVMDELAKQKIKVYPILVHEKDVISRSLKRRGGYLLDVFADPDGEIIKDTQIDGLPTTWIVDKYGKVLITKVGNITSEEILNEISKIK